MTVRDKFVQNTKQLLAEKGIPFRELSRLTGQSRSHISGIVTGKVGVSLTTIENFARVFGVEPWELIK